MHLAHLFASLCGGWGRVGRILSEADAAALAVRFAAAADELQAKADLIREAGNAAVRDASRDPGAIAAAVELLLAMQPRELRPVLDRLVLRARDARCFRHSDGGGI